MLLVVGIGHCAEPSVCRFHNRASESGILLRERLYISDEQITASEFGFYQPFGVCPADCHELLPEPIDDDINCPVAGRVPGTVKQRTDLAACAKRPGLRYEMAQ